MSYMEFLELCKCSPTSDGNDISLLNEIPLELLINLYCSRGNNLNTDNFIKSLGQLGLQNFLVKHKLHFGLTVLRRKAFEDNECSISSKYSSKSTGNSSSILSTSTNISDEGLEDEYFNTVLNYNND